MVNNDYLTVVSYGMHSRFLFVLSRTTFDAVVHLIYMG